MINLKNEGSQNKVSAKVFLYELMTKSSDIKDDYDSVLITGLRSIGHVQFHLLKGDKTVKSTKDMMVERREDVSTRHLKGEAIRHYFYQLMRNKIDDFYHLDYNEVLITNLTKGKNFEVTLRLNGEDVTTTKVDKSMEIGEKTVKYTSRPDYSDPWK
jgi:hypothetical protein